jgi:nitrogen-specific signal transduction histidine kinase/CheY-like chemotaxis protein
MLDQIEHRDDELRRQIRERRSAVEQLHRKEEQLQQAQRMESLGRLAGGVAHDFNNLLTVITGYSELLLARIEPTSPHRGSVDEIRKAGERAAGLTQQLLAFSRKQVLAPRVLSFNDVLASLEKMLLRLIGEDISLHIELDSSLGNVKADPGQIEQVLLNLVVNSRDAMPRGGKLRIRTSNESVEQGQGRHPAMPGGAWVRIRVEDTGCGMAPEVQQRIFEPFYTTKEQGKGTGLGMAMVYGIVKQSGGWIFVDSEVGRGTTIDIYLPRIAELPDTIAARQSLAGIPRGTETVLLVEDEEQVRRFTCHVLENSGYVVIEARDGQEAIAVGEEYPQRIHLMLTDVVMPRMNGREAYERLVSHHPGMKVLFTSGYTDRAIVQEGGVLDEGIAFLRKPFSGHALATRVREILDGVER